MYGGIIAPPLIIGAAAGMSPPDIGLLIAACLFVGGLATILQTVGIPFFGSQLPLVQGVSFAGVSTMVAIVHGGGGIQAVFGSVIAASPDRPAHHSAVLQDHPVLPAGGHRHGHHHHRPDADAGGGQLGHGRQQAKAANYGSMANIGLAAATMAIVLLLSKVGNAAISRLSILLAMVLGTLIAFVFGMADFSKVGHGRDRRLPHAVRFRPADV